MTPKRDLFEDAYLTLAQGITEQKHGVTIAELGCNLEIFEAQGFVSAGV